MKATKTRTPTGKITPNNISPNESPKTNIYAEAIMATDNQQLTTAAVLNSIKQPSTTNYKSTESLITLFQAKQKSRRKIKSLF